MSFERGEDWKLVTFSGTARDEAQAVSIRLIHTSDCIIDLMSVHIAFSFTDRVEPVDREMFMLKGF